MLLTRNEIDHLDKRRRAALINSITGFKPANLVGTRSTAGLSNLAIISSAVHLGSHPPLIAMIFRPDTAPRHSLDNIRETGEFTLNHVSRDMVRRAHGTAARYPADVSEFDACGFEEETIAPMKAPFVAEAKIRIGLSLADEHPLKINGTHMVIGEVQLVELPNASLTERGHADLEQAGTVALSGLDSYHHTGVLNTLAYAKPGVAVTDLRD